MLKFYYKAGLYPTTMQACYRDYNEDMYKNVKDNFLAKFNLQEDPYKTKIKDLDNLEFFLNFNSYAIIDKENNKILDLAFDNLMDFVWILQVYNVDGIQFEIPAQVYKQIEKDFKLLSDRIIKIKESNNENKNMEVNQ